ncbi:MAG TPA: c-type cytochrome [Vicinamibacterales bacterium]|nr:c-type cytochrome [Vicinamibacterales bacterium]
MVLRRCLTWGGVVLMITPLLLAATPPASTQESALETGRAIYLRECASCHGNAATGYGPAWPVLRQPPPDLTVLSRHDRPFEGKRVRDLVIGHMRRVPPHWPSEMPYWRHAPDSELDALIAYLESVQSMPYGPYKGITINDQARLGAPLYQLMCTTCHGEDGRGPKQSGYVVGHGVPDLTTIAARSGGTIDMRRLYEAIARCSDDTTMPSTQRSFERWGMSPIEAARNIEDLAWYVESIQRR